MIGQFIKFRYSFYMSTHNCFFLFKHSNVAIYFYIGELFVMEISQCSRHLVFTFVIKQYVEGACVVINFELCPHRLLYSSQDSAAQNNIVDRVPVVFTHIIWPRLTVCHHFYCDRSKNFCFSSFLCSLVLLLLINSWCKSSHSLHV